MEGLSRIRRFAYGFETDDDRAWLRAGLKRYLLAADDDLRLEDVFELSTPAHSPPWWRLDAQNRRDMWIRELARAYVARQSISAQADVIEQMLARYAAGQWRFDRCLTRLPADAINTPRQFMFYAFEADAAVPSTRQIRRILASR